MAFVARSARAAIAASGVTPLRVRKLKSRAAIDGVVLTPSSFMSAEDIDSAVRAAYALCSVCSVQRMRMQRLQRLQQMRMQRAADANAADANAADANAADANAVDANAADANAARAKNACAVTRERCVVSSWTRQLSCTRQRGRQMTRRK